MDAERLLRRHQDAVYRQMVRLCGNREDAEDVLSEAMLNAYRAIDSLQDPAAFQGWLAKIGRRVCLRMRERQELWPVFALSGIGHDDPRVASPPKAQRSAELAEASRCVKAALEALPPPYRAVYERRELDGATADEVARELGISVAAVKSRLHRARASVREHLSGSMCGPDT